MMPSPKATVPVAIALSIGGGFAGLARCSFPQNAKCVDQCEVMVEVPISQEDEDLCDNQRVVHHEGVGDMQRNVVAHSFEPRALD